MYTQDGKYGTTTSAPSSQYETKGQDYPEPSLPCLHQSADELLKHVSELEHRMGKIDDNLFGERIEKAGDVRPASSSIQQKVAEACSRVACLCGVAGTIGNKLAGIT